MARTRLQQLSLRSTYAACMILLVLTSVLWIAYGAYMSRRSSQTLQWVSNLNLVGTALLAYHYDHGRFPPAYLVDSKGRPAHSWRVLILPYLDCDDLYDEYDFQEPWNSSSNARLASRIPPFYRFPGQYGPNTNIVALTGIGTAFPFAEATALSDFSDGRENIALLTEVADSGIQWLEPRDIDLRAADVAVNVLPSGVGGREPIMFFADGRMFTVSEQLPVSELQALATVDGDESTTRDDLTDQLLLRSR